MREIERLRLAKFFRSKPEQAKQAGKAEMKKADKSLREWGNSHRRGIDAASKKR